MRTLRPRRSSRPWCRTRRRCGPRWSGRRRRGGNSTPFWAVAGRPARPSVASMPAGASLVGAPAFLLLSLCSACRHPAAPGPWHQETGFRWRDLAVPRRGGHGVFTERTAEAGLASHSGSMTMTLTDVDGDGHLDLYVANYKTRSAMDVYSPQERAFDQVVRDLGHQHFEVVPKFRQDYRVVDRPEYNLVSMQQRADPDGFYLNDGKGHFTLVPWTSGRFRDEDGRPLAAAPEYFGLSAKFTDIDGDGAPDLYVCDDFEDPDMFWLNDGTGTFRAVPRLAVRNTSNSSMA